MAWQRPAASGHLQGITCVSCTVDPPQDQEAEQFVQSQRAKGAGILSCDASGAPVLCFCLQKTFIPAGLFLAESNVSWSNAVIIFALFPNWGFCLFLPLPWLSLGMHAPVFRCYLLITMPQVWLSVVHIVELAQATSMVSIPHGHVQQVVDQFFRCVVSAGWEDLAHSKFHWLCHFHDRQKRVSFLRSCFCHERKHKQVKKISSNTFNPVG